METRPVELIRRPPPHDRERATRGYEERHPSSGPRPDFAPAHGQLRVFAIDPAPFFAAGFNEILATRMRGLPIVCPRLAVAVPPFRRLGPHWLGVALTPWTVQAIWACGDRESWRETRAGAERELSLPGGDFGFLGVVDSVLGQYLMCSLKSPVDDFADQAAAEEFARVCLDLMASRQAESDPPEEARPAPRPMSRRRLLARLATGSK